MKNLEQIGASNYAITGCGKVYSLNTNRFLKGWIDSVGYQAVALTADDNTVKQLKVHRIVADVFCANDNPSTKTQVNHIDGDKLNNNHTNLEWCTPSHNTKHAHNTGLNKGKSYNPECIVKVEDVVHDPYVPAEEDMYGVSEDRVRGICEMISEGYRDVDISRITGLNRRYICNIRHNEAKIWSHIVGEYNFSFKKEVRLSPEKVIEVCELLSAGIGVLEIARNLGLCRKQVGNIKNRKTFKKISTDYKF